MLGKWHVAATVWASAATESKRMARACAWTVVSRFPRFNPPGSPPDLFKLIVMLPRTFNWDAQHHRVELNDKAVSNLFEPGNCVPSACRVGMGGPTKPNTATRRLAFGICDTIHRSRHISFAHMNSDTLPSSRKFLLEVANSNGLATLTSRTGVGRSHVLHFREWLHVFEYTGVQAQLGHKGKFERENKNYPQKRTSRSRAQILRGEALTLS
ncbi:hypothetical protein GGX14DRAFT_408884 [Mycena pura]|uniref:Uncharacterized protein n=1 Tax=Mycena pura TaxID=153505 RepID=A0AAD6UK81_9AGAR|nr:hypothetical protein GGX14DRAFT_408884 [Mycena pura]